MEKEQLNFLSTAAGVMVERLKTPLMENLDLSVIKFESYQHGYMSNLTHLFGGIPSYEEANLLAQMAMSEKEDYEIIAILPGWNRGIKKRHPAEYKNAKELSEKYKYVKIGGDSK